MSIATRRQHALDFVHHSLWTADMFQNGIAFDALERIPRKRQSLCVRDNVHTRHRKQVDINVAVHHQACPADVKTPTAERKIRWLGWVHDEWCWW